MKVSVIIPVYKVENFIERCVVSLLSQTLQDAEFIFVDDASPDSSIKILKKCIREYPQRAKHIKILTHERNKGLPAARNTGLAVAQGEYIFHCDSDDFVEPDMLEQMYNTAKGNDADIVWCDWYLSFESSERYMHQPCYNTPTEALKAMLAGTMKFNVWNKLVRNQLYKDNGVKFPEGYAMGEDMTMMLLFIHARNVIYIPSAFYHYVKTNPEAYSRRYSKNDMYSLIHNINIVEEEVHKQFGQSLDLEIGCMKLEAKFPFLMSSSSNMYRLWKSTFPEANKFINKNHYITMRRRFVQWCASKGLWLPVRLHYLLIDKIVYGLFFK